MNFVVPSQSICLFLFVLLLQAVVVVDREFPTLSGEILDFLQSLPGMHFVSFPTNVPLLTNVRVYSGLKSCVFSFGTDGSLNPLYLEAVEERSAINSMLHYTAVTHSYFNVQQKLVNTIDKPKQPKFGM